MTEPHFDDENLMAFADGEVDPETHAAIERAMKNDSEFAARVKRFSNSRAQAKAALGPLLDEPVPDDLLARINAMVDEQAGTTGSVAPDVIRFKPKTPMLAAFTSSYVALPLAASIMLFAGGIAGYFIGQSTPQATNNVQMISLDRQDIALALNSIASGKEISIGDQGDRFRAIATFTDVDETLCREFEVDQADSASIVAVACRAGSSWKIQFTVVAGQNSSGYAPASSLQTLDAYLAAIGADEPLSAEAEEVAIKSLR